MKLSCISLTRAQSSMCTETCYQPEHKPACVEIPACQHADRPVHYLTTHLGVLVSPENSPCVQEMIDEADRDGDGEVNEEEFFRIMKKTTLF